MCKNTAESDRAQMTIWHMRLAFWIPKATNRPVPVAARSKAQVYGRAPAEIVGSNPTGDMDVCLL